MDSFEYPIGHSIDSNFDILQPDFIPETDFQNLLSAIQCETNPTDIFCLDSECNHFTNACTPLQLSPQLYDHNETIDGVGTDIGIDIDVDIDIDIDIDVDIDIPDGNDTSIGIYDGMDPNLYDHNEAIDGIGIDFDISSGSGSATGNADDTGISFYDGVDPNLYDYVEAIDGIGMDIHNGSATGTGNDNGTDGIGYYDEMDPNLYLIWDEEEDDVMASGDGDSSEILTTRNPNSKRRSGGGVKGNRSKALISERKRRSGMKENLYALRTLVPNISKMDKASIVGDATQHIQDLQTLARNLRSEIAKIEEANNQKTPSQNPNKTHVSKSPPILKKIMKMDMFKVEEKEYYVKLVCNKGRGVAAALHKGLESIKSYEVQSSNLATVGDTLVLKFTLKVLATHKLDINLPNLKLWVSGVFLNQGFKFSHRHKFKQGR